MKLFIALFFILGVSYSALGNQDPRSYCETDVEEFYKNAFLTGQIANEMGLLRAVEPSRFSFFGSITVAQKQSKLDILSRSQLTHQETADFNKKNINLFFRLFLRINADEQLTTQSSAYFLAGHAQLAIETNDISRLAQAKGTMKERRINEEQLRIRLIEENQHYKSIKDQMKANCSRATNFSSTIYTSYLNLRSQRI